MNTHFFEKLIKTLPLIVALLPWQIVMMGRLVPRVNCVANKPTQRVRARSLQDVWPRRRKW
jgi:hypothetical protein